MRMHACMHYWLNSESAFIAKQMEEPGFLYHDLDAHNWMDPPIVCSLHPLHRDPLSYRVVFDHARARKSLRKRSPSYCVLNVAQK